LERILISIENISLSAEMLDTPTAKLILQSLPLEGKANTWGEEIYFEIPLETGLEPEARADVEVGELGYWPTGHAFCIFFGPTPMSSGGNPVAASAVNVFGRIASDCSLMKTVSSGALVSVKRE
jgi:hypothetical protein